MSKADELKARTEAFAVDVLNFCKTLPPTVEGRRLSQQLGDAASSVGANYRAACRARSRAEFISKLGTVIEEADESAYWLSVIVKTQLSTAEATSGLHQEADELTAIFTASVRTARSHRRR